MIENISLILMGAGSSSRFKNNKLKVKKQWLRIDKKPLWLFVADRFNSFFDFKETIITAELKEQKYMQNFCDYKIICGGESRQESLKKALEHVESKYVLVSDIARACIDKDMIFRVLNEIDKADCVVPFIRPSDTVVFQNETVNRDDIKMIQTPQLSKTETLKKALNTDTIFTDESSAIKANGGSVVYVDGSANAHKITYFSDLKKLKCLKAPSNEIFIGQGIDIHGFEDNKKMFLGGIEIPSNFGFKAHSDGDVMIHSIIDALLGAIGAGDIGEWFPDSDETYKNIDSKKLLQIVTDFVYNVGYEIINVDITLLAEVPKLSPYKLEMKNSLSRLLQIPKERLNIKATTTEKLGFVGRKEGVVVISVVSLRFFDWMNDEYINS